jgi:hypothetical protein
MKHRNSMSGKPLLSVSMNVRGSSLNFLPEIRGLPKESKSRGSLKKLDSGVREQVIL